VEKKIQRPPAKKRNGLCLAFNRRKISKLVPMSCKYKNYFLCEVNYSKKILKLSRDVFRVPDRNDDFSI